MTGQGIAICLGLLLTFVAIYVLVPHVIGRCLLYYWPLKSMWTFALAFIAIDLLLIAAATWWIFHILAAMELHELQATGDNDVGIYYGGMEMMIVIADLIGLPVSIWAGLSVRHSHRDRNGRMS